MSNRLWALIGAAGGIAYVVLGIVGSDVLMNEQSQPAVNASPHKIAAYFAAHPANTGRWVGGYVALLGMLALIGFVAYLWDVLRRADPESWLPSLVLTGGIVAATAKLVSFAPVFALYYRPGLNPQLAAALFDLGNAAFALTEAAAALMLVGVAAVTLRTAVLPRWLGISAGALAAILLVAVPASGTPGFLLFLVWLVAASVVLMRRVGSGEPVTAAVPQRA
jgi:hypothetical protein